MSSLEVAFPVRYSAVVRLSSVQATRPRTAPVTSPHLGLEGRVAVALGGTSGIGQAIALGLAAAGADVVASARGADNLDATARAIEAHGRRTLRVPSDVTDRPSLEKLLAAVVAAFGKVDILVNAAGRTQRTPTLDLGEAEWNALLDLNLTGTLRACQVFGRGMLA